MTRNNILFFSAFSAVLRLFFLFTIGAKLPALAFINLELDFVFSHGNLPVLERTED